MAHSLIDLKERIAIADGFTHEERMFILDAVNAVATKDADAAYHSPQNYLGRVESLWAALSIDEGGEGLCAAPLRDGTTIPLIAADRRRLDQIIPIARHIAAATRKPVRLVKFTKREDVDLYRADDG